MLVSGSYVASDIWDKKQQSKEKIGFARDVLGYRWRMSQAEESGRFYTVQTALRGFSDVMQSQFSTALNDSIYCVESPDGILPSGKNGVTIMQYADNNMGAGVASQFDGYRSLVVGFPIETIVDAKQREELIKRAMEYLCEK